MYIKVGDSIKLKFLRMRYLANTSALKTQPMMFPK